MNFEEIKIVTARSASDLTNTVNGLLRDGWKAKGSHQVVTTHMQNRYAGSQHMDTTYKQEYSLTLIRKNEQ